MCGIFGVVTKDSDAGAEVLAGLKKLEYRGYDSWGIAVRTQEPQIRITKDTGKISQVTTTFAEGSSALGHTRWATHGGVTKKNAHPHRVGRVTLVHNGIVENFQELKKKLSKTYTFKTQTDSEVVAALIDSKLGKQTDPKVAIRKVAKEIDGRFALVVFVEGHDETYALRRGSPLIVGRGTSAMFIASDIPAFLEETRVVNYLDDDEMVVIENDRASFFSLTNGKPIRKRNITVPWDVEGAEKGRWPHFMLKEIFEQKETIARSINHKSVDIQKFATMLQSANGVYIIGSGTAHKAAVAGEYFFADVAQRKVNVVLSEEMAPFRTFIKKNTAIVAISQSGETADLLETLEYGKKAGAKILSITNVPSSSIARMSDMHLPLNAGPEKAVASTKATTAQMALLFLLSYADAGKLNQGRSLLNLTAANINDLLNPRYATHIKKITRSIAKHNDMFILGRNALYPIALEAAIKIQEVSYIHAHGFAAGEFKHGPIALIEKGAPCVVLGSDKETQTNAIELKSRGAYVLGIAPEKLSVFDDWIRVPDCNGAQPLATVIPVQLLAYYLAIERKLDPDQPRNLAKSVTVK